MSESELQPDLLSLLPAERLLLAQITGWDLPRPWFDVWLLGRLTLQRELENAQAELRRLDARDAAPAPRDVTGLLEPSFAELSRARNDHRAEAHALRRATANQNFGRGVA